jgi:ribose transport system ATP-binding protein
VSAALLEFRGVSKRFGGTQAVDAVSFDVHAGEIVALLGENGAGKSTLIKLLAGIFAIDSGEMRFDGQPESAWRSSDRAHQPVAFIHQDLGLVEWMTVAENVALGMGYPRRFGLIDWPAARATARRRQRNPKMVSNGRSSPSGPLAKVAQANNNATAIELTWVYLPSRYMK